MKYLLHGFAILPILTAPITAADDLPEILVRGHQDSELQQFTVEASDSPVVLPDATALMARVPGGGVNFNGALSGLVQYRGLFGPRVNVSLDGAYMHQGGPNWMDPPLHYVPASLLEEFHLERGIASVSSGSGIGGHAAVKTKSSHFTDGAAFSTGFEGDLMAHSKDGGYGVGGIATLANARHRIHLLAARDAGEDYDAGRGRVAATEYQRDYYGIGYGLRAGAHELALDFMHIDTGDSGTPSLPLDIALFDTDTVTGHYRGKWGELGVDAHLRYGNIDHRMANFVLRPPPDVSSLPLPPFLGPDARFVDARSDSLSYAVRLTHPLLSGTVSMGADGHFETYDVAVGDPDFAPFFVTNFNDSEEDTYGFFGEWRGMLSGKLGLEAGIRFQRTQSDSGPVDAFPAQIAGAFPPGSPPQAVLALRERFNASDRSKGESDLDWVLKLSYALTDSIELHLGGACKSRAPSYTERYLWIPLEINSGLGDGNNYVGDVDLDSEVSHEVEAGFDWQTERGYFYPRGFYRSVDDYIQGIPVPVTPFDMPVIGVSANANGDPTPLRFANVDAELYGFDAEFGLRLAPNWRVDGLLTYVRGKRRDVDDNLFRITPPTARFDLSYERAQWFVTLESVFTARQDHISQTNTDDPANPNNSNAETPGYILLNAFGQYHTPDERIRITAGIENIADKEYTDHLSGFNRVLGSDVPIGKRLPGSGLNAFGRLSVRWQ